MTTQETAGDHGEKRIRVDELEAPIPPVAQNEAPILYPVSFDLETRNVEIAVDVPLLEEPAETSGDNNQGWITEEACLQSRLVHDTSTATQGGKHESVDICRET